MVNNHQNTKYDLRQRFAKNRIIRSTCRHAWSGQPHEEKLQKIDQFFWNVFNCAREHSRLIQIETFIFAAKQCN